jgi:hypothetical protein
MIRISKLLIALCQGAFGDPLDVLDILSFPLRPKHPKLNDINTFTQH